MRHALYFIVTLLTASLASAQTGQPATSGPLVLERIHNGWVLAPDFKITDLDNRTGQLAGVYGGRWVDDTVLFGAAGYWLTNNARDYQMGYGGLLVGWQSKEFGRIRFGGRGLVGGGRATLGTEFPSFRNVPGNRVSSPRDVRFGVATQFRAPAPRLAVRDEFFVFEPQATVSARLVEHLGLSCGVSYRSTAGSDVLGDRLNGPAANLAVQVGW